MAKKKKIIEEHKSEPVTNCDQSKEVVTNCDNLVVNEETFSQSDIEKMIITIRGVQVMIDRDLARVYKVTTSQLNQQVKRNINRFPDDFMFQLTKSEHDSLKSQIVTSNFVNNQGDISLTSQNVILKKGRGQHTKYMPYVFTRNGIGMLSSVLRASLKDVGTSLCAVKKMEVSPDRLLEFLK